MLRCRRYGFLPCHSESAIKLANDPVALADAGAGYTFALNFADNTKVWVMQFSVFSAALRKERKELHSSAVGVGWRRYQKLRKNSTGGKGGQTTLDSFFKPGPANRRAAGRTGALWSKVSEPMEGGRQQRTMGRQVTPHQGRGAYHQATIVQFAGQTRAAAIGTCWQKLPLWEQKWHCRQTGVEVVHALAVRQEGRPDRTAGVQTTPSQRSSCVGYAAQRGMQWMANVNSAR